MFFSNKAMATTKHAKQFSIRTRHFYLYIIWNHKRIYYITYTTQLDGQSPVQLVNSRLYGNTVHLALLVCVPPLKAVQPT